MCSVLFFSEPFTVVTFCAALIGGGLSCAGLTSHEGMPMWDLSWTWPGPQVSTSRVKPLIMISIVIIVFISGMHKHTVI